MHNIFSPTHEIQVKQQYEQAAPQAFTPAPSRSVKLPEQFFSAQKNVNPFSFENVIETKTPEPASQKQETTFVQEHDEYELIGQYKQTYILIAKQNDLILIDQHAAHERILYEQYKNNPEPQPSIRLLFPHIIHTTQLDADRLEPHFGLFAHHGITLERFSDTQLCIYATPVGTKNEQLTEIITACLAITHKENIENLLHETLYAQISCASAIKAGQTLTQETMHEIIIQLMKTHNNTTCPHGRPTHIAFFEQDITKYFKRDYTHKKIDYEHNVL